MEKAKLLTISIIGLLLLNLGTLGFLFLHGGPKGHRPPPHEGMGGPKPREIIIEKLHFDAQQQKEYDKLIEWHQATIRRLDDSIRQTKNELYAQLSEPQINAKVKDSLAAQLANYQKQIEETHFKHFEDIKKICHPGQMPDFKALTEELARIFAANKPPRPPRE